MGPNCSLSGRSVGRMAGRPRAFFAVSLFKNPVQARGFSGVRATGRVINYRSLIPDGLRIRNVGSLI